MFYIIIVVQAVVAMKPQKSNGTFDSSAQWEFVIISGNELGTGEDLFTVTYDFTVQTLTKLYLHTV